MTNQMNTKLVALSALFRKLFFHSLIFNSNYNKKKVKTVADLEMFFDSGLF